MGIPLSDFQIFISWLALPAFAVAFLSPALPKSAKAICEIHNQAVDERIATFETKSRTESDQRNLISEQDERHPILVAEFR
jgi:L-amino acid N-acyltransferase YncA